MARKKILKAAAEKADATKLAQRERWQASFVAGDCLQAHTRDSEGLSNKGYAYRIALLHRAVTGERCTLADMRETYRMTLHSDSKLRAWLAKWPHMYDSGLTRLGSFNVPTCSVDWRVPKSKAAAKRQLDGLLAQLRDSVKAQKKSTAK